MSSFLQYSRRFPLYEVLSCSYLLPTDILVDERQLSFRLVCEKSVETSENGDVLNSRCEIMWDGFRSWCRSLECPAITSSVREVSHTQLRWPLQEDYNIEDVAATVEDKVTSAVERLQMSFLSRLPSFGGLSDGPTNS